MSSKNNVNKDFYTIAGRDRPNEVLAEAAMKHLGDAPPMRRAGARPNFIPGAPPVGESPVVDEHEAQASAGKTGPRSGSVKRATARRGGKAPGHARPGAGTSGGERRKSLDRESAKRGTTQGKAARRRRRRAA